MKWYRFFLGLLLLLAPAMVRAQILMPDGRYKLMATVVDGDTLPLINLRSVDISAPMSPEAAAKLMAFKPYAKLAAVQLRYINDSIAHFTNEHDKKKFIKETEKKLREDFEKDITKLTVTQGKILIKLVDRETGSTSYALVKELRGSIRAFLFQGLARLFGENLKSEFDGPGEDAAIEAIVKQIEKGQLLVQPIKH
jgi:hypothetical protein